MSKVTFIANYRGVNAYALNVIVGALEAAGLGETDDDIALVREPATLATAIMHALDKGRRVIVGWSFYSTNFLPSVEDLNRVKRVINDSRVIHLAGGVHASAEPEETLRAGFDLVVQGEGEQTSVDLLTALRSDQEIATVTGLAYLDRGLMRSTGPGRRASLDEFPAFAVQRKRHNPIEITRGCIYSCKFCQTPFMFKAKFRHRSVDNVCSHVGIMRDRGLTEVRFITPTSLSYGTQTTEPDLEAVENLLSSVRNTLGSSGKIFFGSFPSEVRPEHVSRPALELLKRYVSNDNLIIGGQSGSMAMLETSNRGHGVHEIIRAVELCVEIGFKPNVDFIFGMPGETEDDARASLDLADHLSSIGARIHGHTFMPLPGTPWRNTPAGAMSPKSLNQLRRLESRGALYGQWKSQQEVAKTLVTLGRRAPKDDMGPSSVALQHEVKPE